MSLIGNEHGWTYTIDLEIFVLGNFRMINFCIENFSYDEPFTTLTLQCNCAHTFS